ncbi:hypothetical protein EW053_04560 [Streptomyces sp. IB2014 016-6]|nr:hypothetical protein EW053_04560 [Streptomyces sp. IB2014 016-6]
MTCTWIANGGCTGADGGGGGAGTTGGAGGGAGGGGRHGGASPGCGGRAGSGTPGGKIRLGMIGLSAIGQLPFTVSSWSSRSARIRWARVCPMRNPD